MSKQIVTAGQGVFPWGVDPRNRVLVDSTRSVVVTGQELVAGKPLALDGSTTAANVGKLKSAAAAGDIFYGLSSSNLNTLYGNVSLGEWTSVRANAELQGIYTVRQSVFLDSNGDEVTINPFEAGVWDGGADFPQANDVGALLAAKVVTIETELGGGSHLAWTPSTGATGNGFDEVAVIVDVRGEEVDIMLPNKLSVYAAL
jgi:hypothetical protein